MNGMDVNEKINVYECVKGIEYDKLVRNYYVF